MTTPNPLSHQPTVQPPVKTNSRVNGSPRGPQGVPEPQPNSQWFIANEGNYQGPFSVEQICQRLEQGRLARRELAWREGMSEWLPLENIEDFAAFAAMAPLEIFNPLAEGVDFADAPDVLSSGPNSGSISDLGSFESLSTKAAEAPVVTKQTPAVVASEATPTGTKKKKKSKLKEAAAKTPVDFEQQFVEKLRARKAREAARERVMKQNGLLKDAGDVSNALKDESVRGFFDPDDSWKKFFDIQQPTYTAAEKRAAFVRRTKKTLGSQKGLALLAAVCVGSAFLFVGFEVVRSSHTPELNDVTREENLELRSALSSSLSDSLGGAKPVVRIAKSTVDAFAPVFYIASRLTDGTRLDVMIEGKPETLVERLRVSVHALVTVKDGIARTPPFRQENGQPYPRGEYQVAISCSGCTKAAPTGGALVAEKKISLAEKSYFLGGAKNEDYDQKLKAHHDGVRAQAKEELNELKQVIETLDTQAKDSTRVFGAVIGSIRANPKLLAAKSAEWTAFDTRWQQLQAQMNELFARWTPETLEANYFHANLYHFLKKIGERVAHLQQAQTQRMGNDQTRLVLDAARAAEWTAVTNDLKKLRAKIKQAEELPTTSTGMPQRVAF